MARDIALHGDLCFVRTRRQALRVGFTAVRPCHRAPYDEEPVDRRLALSIGGERRIDRNPRRTMVRARPGTRCA